MRSWVAVVALSAAVVLTASTQALAGSAGRSAAASFAKGMEVLREGDLDGALEAFGSAARAEQDNPLYGQQYMLVRRVLKTREAIAKETDPEKWWRMALALRSFYYAHGLHGEVVGLGRQMHQKQPSVGSATILADAHLALGQNAEAAQALAGVDAKRLTLQAKALLGIALARQKKTERAKALLGQVTVPDDASPRFLFDVARLRMLCGDAEGGLATLKTAFESTTPRALDALRNLARTSGDFASVAGGDAFAEVLTTKSKVVESPCSSGAGCGSCPSRRGCPSSGGKACR